MDYFFWLLIAFACFMFFYLAKIFVKYEYSFDELKEMIYQLELRLVRLNSSQIKNLKFKKDDLLPKDYMKRKPIPYRSLLITIHFKSYYDNCELYIEFFEEYFQRIKEYRKFTLVLIVGLIIIFGIGFLAKALL